MSEEEHEHSQKLIKYQNLRGGRVVFNPVSEPTEQEFASPLLALEFALSFEKKLNQSLLDLHKLATERTDPHLCDYLEEHFLKEQVETIHKIAKLHTNLTRVGDGLGVFLFDKDLQS